MSSVTNVILTFSRIENEEDIDNFLNGFPNQGRGFKIVSITDKSLPHGWYGGTKRIECSIYIGAYNNFNYLEFLSYLKTYQWDSPEEIQLFVKEQWDILFSIHNIV